MLPTQHCPKTATNTRRDGRTPHTITSRWYVQDARGAAACLIFFGWDFFGGMRHHRPLVCHTLLCPSSTQDSDDSEREHEVAEVLFDLANMFPPPAAPKAASRKRDHSSANGKQPAHASNGKHPAIPEALSKFAKRCSSHVYIAAFIKHQQELQRAQGVMAQPDSSKPDWRPPPDPAAIAAFSAAAAAAAAGGVPTIPPFIAAAAAAAASHPLHSGTPLLVPPPGQLPLAHMPAPPLAPLLTAPGFFFPPGAAPFPGAPTAAFVPGAAPSPLSIFGPAPFLPPGFPAAALPQMATAECAIAASLAPNAVCGGCVAVGVGEKWENQPCVSVATQAQVRPVVAPTSEPIKMENGVEAAPSAAVEQAAGA